MYRTACPVNVLSRLELCAQQTPLNLLKAPLVAQKKVSRNVCESENDNLSRRNDENITEPEQEQRTNSSRRLRSRLGDKFDFEEFC